MFLCIKKLKTLTVLCINLKNLKERIIAKVGMYISLLKQEFILQIIVDLWILIDTLCNVKSGCYKTK